MVIGMNGVGRRYTVVMANFTSKVQELLHSPKAREMVDKARTVANKPENREKFRHLSSKFTGKGHHPDGGGPGGVPPSGHASSSAGAPGSSGVPGSSDASSPLSGGHGDHERPTPGPF